MLGPLELQLQLWTSPPHLCPSACTAFPSCKKQCSSTQGEWQLDGASLSNLDSWAQGPLGSWEARARWVPHQVNGSSPARPVHLVAHTLIDTVPAYGLQGHRSG